MSNYDYEAMYEKRFVRNLRRYSSLRQKIKRLVEFAWLPQCPY